MKRSLWRFLVSKKRLITKSKAISVLNKIPRPVMLLSMTLSIVYVSLINLYVNNHQGPINVTTGYGVVTGTIYRIEEKNGTIKVYLNNVQIDSDNKSVRDLIELKNEKVIYKNTGVICSFDSDLKELNYGNIISVKGRIGMYERATNPGQFDSRKYYLSQNIFFRMDKCEIIKSADKKNIITSALRRIRGRLEEAVNKSLNQEDAGLMNAIMFADKNGVDKGVKELYTTAGAGHLLAISGLHISLIGLSILKLLKKTPIPVSASYIIVTAVLALYGIMIGFTPSAFRAIIMFVIMSVAHITKRSYDSLTALSVSLLITTLLRPLNSLQAGFYMTYLAIVGLALVSKLFMPFKKKCNKIYAGLISSVSVNLTTLPVVMNCYYQIPLYGVFLNLILVPGMSIILVVGAMMIGWELLLPDILNPFAFIIHLVFQIYLLLIKSELKLPASVIVTGHRSMVASVIYLAVLVTLSIVAGLVRKRMWIRRKALRNYQRRNAGRNVSIISKNEKKKHFGYMAIIYLVLGVNIFFLVYHHGKNRIEFLDVGQGLCVAIQYNGQVMLFDGGSTSENDIYKYILKPYLKYYGISEIDAVFISHEDADHTSGLVDMISHEDFEIDNIYCPSILRDNIISLLEGKEKIKGLKAGDILTGENIKCTIISPTMKERDSSSNANSLVMFVKTPSESVLLMADAGDSAEEKVCKYLNDNQIDGVDVYQVAHHGSANETNSKAFIQRINPYISVISCGYNNNYNHPHTETLEALEETDSRILRTDYEGCIKLLFE